MRKQNTQRKAKKRSTTAKKTSTNKSNSEMLLP